MHIYDCLNKSEELRSTYEADRRKQMDLLLPSYLNLDDGRHLRNFLANITGFSIIERSTAAKTHDFRSVSEIEALWDMLCVRVIDLITETVAKISEPRVLLTLKDSVTLFMQTMQVRQVLSSFLPYFP
jgi:exocyst complex component 6